MKHPLNICMLAFASTFAASALAAAPYPHEYENGGHWTQAEVQQKASQQTVADKSAEVDLSISMPPTAAGVAPYTNHPYLNAGHYGEKINGDRF